jgi:DnaK suppressor protein
VNAQTAKPSPPEKGVDAPAESQLTESVALVAQAGDKPAVKVASKASVKRSAAPVPLPVSPGRGLTPVPPPPKTGRAAKLAQAAAQSQDLSVMLPTAKASYTNTMPTPVSNPSTFTPVKKDPLLANNWQAKTAEQLSDAEVLAMPDDEYMNDKQMAFFRLKLTRLKQDILSNAGETTEHLREDTAVVPDPADRATIEEEHALELRTRDRERKLLKKIEQSIVRIDAGDYGFCDETGEPIGVGRLLARPTATLSLEAQQRRELKQKMYGD